MQPNQVDSKTISRAGIAGAVLGVLGISFFILLWIVLGSWGVDNLVRIILSVCLPPIFLSLLVGAYAMSRQQH